MCVNGNCIDGSCQCEEGYAGTLCNELACVNGTFENGKCKCIEGYFGTLCTQDDLIAVYKLTKFQLSDCPNYVPQYNLSGPADQQELCGINASDMEVCFDYNYTIFNESRLFRAEVIRVDNNGEKEVTRNFILAGTYTAQDDLLTIEYIDGSREVLIIEGDKIILSEHLSDGGSADCTFLREFTFSVDL